MIFGLTARALMALAMVIACLAAGSDALAEEAPVFAPVADAVVTSDTDGFHSLRLRATGLYPYDNQWRFSGVALQTAQYGQDNFRKNVAGVLGIYRDQRRDTLAGVDAELGLVRVSGHLRPVGDVTLRMTTTLGSAVDLIASADLVETPIALERGVGYTFVAANIEQQLTEHFTVTALAGLQTFSDGNARTHLRARLIWLADPENGITLQLRYRQFSTRDTDVGGAYFNPAQYRQWLGVAAIRRRYAGWIVTGAMGAGQEHSTGTGSRASYLGEASAEGTITENVRLLLRASYSRSAGFIDSDNYAYRRGSATLVMPFY